MCGIVAYTGTGSAREIVRAGLERLEYRGYDSAGLGVVTTTRQIDRVRAVGGVAALDHAIASNGLADGQVAVGHTRWATHGSVAVENAHPFSGCGGRVLVALNGIIDNHLELREELVWAGHVFESTTDAEVVAHLLDGVDADDLAEAVAAVAARLVGHYAFVVAHRDRPATVVGHRHRCPLVLVAGPDSTLLASSPAAAGDAVGAVMAFEDGDTVAATLGHVEVIDRAGRTVTRPTRTVDPATFRADVDGHESFMRKEMSEQPDAIAATITSAQRDLVAVVRKPVARVVLTGCGTSLHAAQVGRMMVEEWAGLPCSIEAAAEWPSSLRLEADTLVVGLTQSGETADTIAALLSAAEQGARTCVITNVTESLAAQEADLVIETAAGLEVGVAATKTFAAQISALTVLAVGLGAANGSLSRARTTEVLSALRAAPDHVRRVLELDEHIERVAKLLADATHAMYLGRHANLPVALEGALKIKEIAYLPVESCSAGEMKHGPIALVDDEVPVVIVATPGPSYDKTLANIHEIGARGGQIIAVVAEGDQRAAALAHEVIEVPTCEPLLAPIVSTVALQLLAYHAARHRGLDPDRPRNLAKTVTVE